jgi:hypothetical protein
MFTTFASQFCVLENAVLMGDIIYKISQELG